MINARLVVILAVTMLLSLCACNKKEQASSREAETKADAVRVESDMESAKPQDEPAVREAASLYDFTVKSWDGKDISLKNYQGKTVLIVNTAIACGFTPQYEGLEAVYQKYHEKGLEILDFPCNQFGAQAPGTDEEIHQFRAEQYKLSFPQFAKIDVNGEQAAPLYQYLVSLKGFAGFDPESELSPVLDKVLSKDHPDYKETPDIKWNFTKFLFDKNGKFIDRYELTTTPEMLDKIIEKVISESAALDGV